MSHPPELFIQVAPLETAIEIMREAALWLIDIKQPLWKIEDLTLEKLRDRCQPDEVFVGYVDGHAAVAALIQERDPFLWPDDQQALYIHKLAVRRSHAGQDLPAKLLDWTADRAVSSGRHLLRLDCAADRPKLRSFYEQQGFGHIELRMFGQLQVALYQKPLTRRQTLA